MLMPALVFAPFVEASLVDTDLRIQLACGMTSAGYRRVIMGRPETPYQRISSSVRVIDGTVPFFTVPSLVSISIERCASDLYCFFDTNVGAICGQMIPA